MHEELIAAAERALSDALGSAHRLGVIGAIGNAGRRNLVLRCSVSASSARSPGTVLIKQVGMTEYEPAKPDGSASRLFNEWCGLEFLGGLDGGPGLAPRWFAGSRAGGFIVLEDLGQVQTLAELLLAEASAPAQQALLSYAAALGRLHATTIGRADEYQARRAALGPIDASPTAPYVQSLREGVATATAALLRLDIVPDAGFANEAESVARAIADPGPFLAYSHGDPCLDNCLVPAGEARLIDFEFGSYRHALLDGVFARMSFPICWCVNRLPAAIVEDMERTYRLELATRCVAAGDPARFALAHGDACAFWALITLAHILPRALDGVANFGISTHRQRVPARLEAFVGLGDARYPALSSIMRRTCAKLEQRWSREEATLPIFPAFRAELPGPSPS